MRDHFLHSTAINKYGVAGWDGKGINEYLEVLGKDRIKGE